MEGHKVRYTYGDKSTTGKVMDKVKVYVSNGGNEDKYVILNEGGELHLVDPGDLVSLEPVTFG